MERDLEGAFQRLQVQLQRDSKKDHLKIGEKFFFSVLEKGLGDDSSWGRINSQTTEL